MTKQQKKKIVRPPLTKEQRREKERLRKAYERNKKRWKAVHGESLSQEKLGQMVEEWLKGRKTYTQGAVNQFLNPKSDTKLSELFVWAVADILEFDPAEIGESYARSDRPLSEGKESPYVRSFSEEFLQLPEEAQDDAYEEAMKLLQKYKK